MTMLLRILCSIISLMCIAGCAAKPAVKIYYSREELEKDFGTKEELIAMAGRPSQILTMPDDTELWIYYSAEKDNTMTNGGICGFTVRVTHDGKVNRWDPMSRRQTTTVSVRISPPRADKAPVALVDPISFHVAYEEPAPGGIAIDLPGLSTPLYIDSEAVMTITNVIEIARGQICTIHITEGRGRRSDSPTVSVTLTADDAIRFAELTKRNVGRKLLVRWGTDNICAPMVRAPISGAFYIGVTTNNRDAIESHLLRQATAYPVHPEKSIPIGVQNDSVMGRDGEDGD